MLGRAKPQAVSLMQAAIGFHVLFPANYLLLIKNLGLERYCG